MTAADYVEHVEGKEDFVGGAQFADVSLTLTQLKINKQKFKVKTKKKQRHETDTFNKEKIYGICCY